MVKVGSMNRARRILVIAGGVVRSVNGASASWFRHSEAEKAPSTAAAPEAGMMLNAIEVESPPSVRLLLRTTGTPVYTSYSPAPARFVVDLTSTTKSPSLTLPSPLPAPISSMSVEDVTEMGTRLTRVTVILTQPSTPQAVASDNLVSINLPPAAMADAHGEEALPAVVSVIPPATQPSAAPFPVSEPEPVRVSEPVITTEPIREASKSASVAGAGAGNAPSLPRAKTLKNVTTSTRDGSVEVTLAADGELAYKAFTLESPTRVVLDLTGVHNKFARSSIATGDATVSRIRISQFTPDVTRVVLDLSQKSDYHVAVDREHLRVTFGPPDAVAVKNEPAPIVAEAAPAAEPLKTAQAMPPPEPVLVTPKAAPPAEAPKQASLAEAQQTGAARSDVPVTSPNSTQLTQQVPAIPADKTPTWNTA